MTGATHQSVVFPDTTVVTTEASVRPPTDASVVTLHSDPASRMCGSVASATLDPSQPVSLAGSGVADFSDSVVANEAAARQPSVGVSSLDLPAASPGVAGLSDCIGDIDADLKAAISALEVSWLRCGIIMNHMTYRSCALSETDASMFSIKPDVAARVIPIEAANNSATGDSNAH